MHYYIKESEQQRQKLKEEYDLVVAERDILGINNLFYFFLRFLNILNNF